MNLEERYRAVERRLKAQGVIRDGDDSELELVKDVDRRVMAAVERTLRKMFIGEEEGMSNIEERIQAIVHQKLDTPEWRASRELRKALGIHGEVSDVQLNKALSTVGEEYVPEARDFYLENSYPGAWENQGGVPDNPNFAPLKNTVALQITKSEMTGMLENLGVKVKRPYGVTPKNPRVMNLNDVDFRR